MLESELTYSEFSMQFHEGLCPFDGNLFTYGVMMRDVFKVRSKKPADIMKLGAIDNMKRLGWNG